MCCLFWGVFLLNRYLPLISFLVMEETFPPLFVGEIEAVAAGWLPCIVQLLSRKAWSEGVAVEQFIPSTPGPQKPAQEVLCDLISLL